VRIIKYPKVAMLPANFFGKNLNSTPPISWRRKDSSVGRIANEPTILIKMRFVWVAAHPRYNLQRSVLNPLTMPCFGALLGARLKIG
jgi:hypothetical protein